jgi:hypothetical protein
MVHGLHPAAARRSQRRSMANRRARRRGGPGIGFGCENYTVDYGLAKVRKLQLNMCW